MMSRPTEEEVRDKLLSSVFRAGKIDEQAAAWSKMLATLLDSMQHEAQHKQQKQLLEILGRMLTAMGEQTKSLSEIHDALMGLSIFVFQQADAVTLKVITDLRWPKDYIAAVEQSLKGLIDPKPEEKPQEEPGPVVDAEVQTVTMPTPFAWLDGTSELSAMAQCRCGSRSLSTVHKVGRAEPVGFICDDCLLKTVWSDQ